MGHSNFGISEPTCEYDDLLYKTVGDLENPPTVVHQHPPHNFVTPQKAKLLTKGYPISKTERFVNE